MRCNKNGCCSVKFCPLVPAWASTIHKFQGFEAGFDDTDQFKYLIVDPGPTSWEQNCPGALYVALSRAKTMGTFWSDTDNPSDSAIYFQGNGICEDRIRDGALKNGNRPGDAKVNCVLIDKREQWVRHLTIREQNTTRKQYTMTEMKQFKATRFTQFQTRDGIMDMVTQPNKSWLRLKRTEKYRVQNNFFGTS